ncbi:MAG: B12-binding domain-containing radical SAM protein [Candidatus Omnitrophica bacterium]|nr:B12-binding domain-containing radical SAM protein [Candidatus Omnitrophota bacterium]
MSRYNSSYLANEINTLVLKRNARFKIALVYPNSYAIGMSNLGVHSVYDLFNQSLDVVCERVFFDLKKKQLFSLETGQALKAFDILAFSISYELDYFYVLKILKDLDLLAPAEQRPVRPLLISGGIVHSFNHRPLAKYCDLIFVGEAEESIPLLIKRLCEFPNINSLLKKNDFLKSFADVDGFFVPGFSDPRAVKPCFIQDLNNFPVCSKIITPDTEFSNTFLVEISRGCPWNCKFCVTSGVCGSFRPRAIKLLIEQIEQGLKLTPKIGLVGAAVSDYPQIEELVAFLRMKNAKISVSSLRVETVKHSLLKALAQSGQNTITFAPETGSDRLRYFLNKKISNKQILEIISAANNLGIRKVKLYFMIGLLTEEAADVLAIVRLVEAVSEIVFVKVSIGIFVPKPKTPFADQLMEDKNILFKKIKLLKAELALLNNVDFNTANIKEAKIAHLLSFADENFFQGYFMKNSL